MMHLVKVGTQSANRSSRELHPEPCMGQAVGKS